MADNMFGPTIRPAAPVGPVLPNAVNPATLAMSQQAQAVPSQPQSNVIYVGNMRGPLSFQGLSFKLMDKWRVQTKWLNLKQ